MPTHKLSIVNTTPQFAFEFTQVIFDNEDVTNQVVEIEVNIDSVNNEVSGYIVLYRPHFIAADEVATYNLL